MENQTKKKGTLVAIITMMFLFAMISFVTNMAAPFGTIWKQHYDWAGMMGNMMNFAAYLFMGIPAGMMITKYGYKKTALVALALGFVGIGVQYVSSTMDGNSISTYVVYLLGAFICGFCVCILNTVVNPMLNLLGGGGNRGNQLIQTGGSLNSLAATLTPMLAGSMIGEITKGTSLQVVTPLLLIALGIFAASFVIVWFTQLTEPETEHADVIGGVKGALAYRQLVLGIIAIFFYVGVEVGIPGQLLFYLSEPVSEGGVLGSAAVAGLIAGIYWLLMLVGRFVSAFISGKVSSRTQLTVTSVVAIALLLIAIFTPEGSKMNLTVPNLAESTLIHAEVPTKVLFIILCGICTSVMWGVIFNLATEGLGKYTATASGLFMTMVVGGGVMPLIQNLMATKIGDIQSYWLIVAMLAYILFFALIGSRPAKKA
ncbi:transporter, major facilitator family protein [Prevotella sp. oral taxon 306 str. F0472]|jgi:sugar transporter|uniref:MFS transporter n=1 Tax=Prevotella sp. oral taxon 306 TaxID=712461 RepID=UPI00025BBE47|nr:MFS transporter [Prevotella sp. oral taxon 306]EID33928.1 transporter, major facilitator family protein [Prevotella sp. oral taxon 306 str. F0472]